MQQIYIPENIVHKYTLVVVDNNDGARLKVSIETVRVKHSATGVTGLKKVRKVSLRDTNTALKVAQEMGSIDAPMKQRA